MDLQKQIKSNLHYYKQLQKVLDAHQTKAASIQLRKDWLERQKINNYTNEYDRIRGLISQNTLKGKTTAHLDKRKKELESLGAKAVDRIA